MSALPLDAVPSVKVYLGLPLFGSRAPPGGSEELARRQGEDYVTELFQPSVIGAASELPAIVEELRARGCMGRSEGIGLFGFSAGGAAVLSALAEQRVNVRAAVVVNAPVNVQATIAALERATGRSYVWTPSAVHIAEQSDAVGRAADIASSNRPPALLILHGADDEIITPGGAVALYRALGPLYHDKRDDQRLRITILPGVSHRWTEPAAIDALRTNATDWYNAFMSDSASAQRPPL